MSFRPSLQPKAATTLVAGLVKPDGTTITGAVDGTLSVPTTAVTSLTDISTAGGPALSDLETLNRSGTDYKASLSALSALFRKTPAGSRTITLAGGSTTATLTASDHDKTVVVAGSVAGTLTVDGTIVDGFRCHVINHTGSALTYSGITGLASTTTLANSAATTVTLANAATEASASGGAGYTLPAATGSTLGGVKQGGGTTIAGDGTISVPASFSVAVSGAVGTLPGGAGAVVYRHVFGRPCSLATNLAAPFGPQMQAITAASASASFGLSKRTAAGSTSSVGTLTISTAGVVSATATATSFAAGDELIITAPSPADSTLADVALTFSGSWS